jgi:CHAD domain-containing protein
MKQEQVKQAKTLGDWAYIAIEKHFHKILKHEDLVIKDKDPEELHQMRVGMRRLRSAVTGLELAVNLPKDAKEKKIGKVARVLGKLRDLDVLRESIENQYQPTLTQAEQGDLKVVLERLKWQRSLALKAAKTALESDDYRHLKQGLKKWLKQPEFQEIARVDIQEILPDLLLPTVSQLLLHPAWWVGLPSTEEINSDRSSEKIEEILTTHGQILHDLRKQTKRSRYQLELFTDLYGEKYQAYVTDLKEIQDILGTIQDCFVLGDFLAEALHSERKKQLSNLVQQLRQNRYRSWQNWQNFQLKYLAGETRQAWHLELLNPIKLDNY